MAVIGYIRVSTDKQTCEHQKYEIKQFAKAQIAKVMGVGRTTLRRFISRQGWA